MRSKVGKGLLSVVLVLGLLLPGVPVLAQDSAETAETRATTSQPGFDQRYEQPGTEYDGFWLIEEHSSGLIDDHIYPDGILQNYVVDIQALYDDPDFDPGVSASGLGSSAANLADSVVGAPYLWGGKGYMWNAGGGWGGGYFVSSTQIKDTGYYYYNPSIGGVSWGKGVDCSGLVFWAFNKAAGKTNYIDSTNPVYHEGAAGQWNDTARFDKLGFTIPSVGSLQPGDLLFINTPAGGTPDHVGMYVGNGYVVHSRGTAGVEKLTLSQWLDLPYGSKQYRDYFHGWGRVVGSGSISPPTAVTHSVDEITETSARLNGQVTDTGGGSWQCRFWLWVDGGWGYFGPYGPYDTVGILRLTVTGLDPCTDYVWAFEAFNAAGNDFGSNMPFTTACSAGSLQVTIEPAGARTAGAQWRLTSGPDTSWKNSGATVSNLPVGSYTVTFNDITGWTKPSNVGVTINKNQTTTLTRTYTQDVGALQVTIEPAGARTAGAQWRLTTGPTRRGRIAVQP